MITEVKSIKDIEQFVRKLIAEGTNAHPDEDFNNYVNVETHKEAYIRIEASIRNTLMEQCFFCLWKTR